MFRLRLESLFPSHHPQEEVNRDRATRAICDIVSLLWQTEQVFKPFLCLLYPPPEVDRMKAGERKSAPEDPVGNAHSFSRGKKDCVIRNRHTRRHGAPSAHGVQGKLGGQDETIAKHPSPALRLAS